MEIDAIAYRQDHIGGKESHEVVPQDVKTSQCDGHIGRKSGNMDPRENGHGQGDRKAHGKDQKHNMARNGPPTPLTVGGTRGQKAGNHEL